MFGEYVKEKRLTKKISLRQFARELGEDPSNWSKIERGTASAPQDETKLAKIAIVLGINKKSEEWNHLFDLAKIDAGRIPDYLMSDKEILKSLPAFFRTVGSIKPKPEEIEKLIDIIRKEG